MIDDVSPATRRLAVECRCWAMGGALSKATQLIDGRLEGAADGLPVPDRVALLVLKAELLHLDCRDDDARRILETAVTPYLSALTQATRLAVARNLNEVGIALLDTGSSGDFYWVHDRQSAAGVSFWDPTAMVHAYEAAAQDRHYDALPAFWQELQNTYHAGCWQYHRQAAARLANEFLQLRSFPKAAHYTIIAEDTNLAAAIGDALLAARDPKPVRQAVNGILERAHLLRHAAPACVIVQHIADAIPEDLVAPITDWLLAICQMEPERRPEPQAFGSAWDALGVLAPRLDTTLAQRAVGVVLKHRLWARPGTYRRRLIRVASGCVVALSPADLRSLASSSLPLVHGLKNDFDFGESVKLLCSIAVAGDDALRALLADALYPSGAQVPTILLQVDHIFGKQFRDARQLDGLAMHVADEIRREVQFVGPDDGAPIAPCHFIQIEHPEGDGKRVVYIASHTQLEVVVRHRQWVNAALLSAIVEAALLMVAEVHNVLQNKSSLLKAIADLADSIPPTLQGQILDVLAPLASGDVLEPPGLMTSAEVSNPLNPSKMASGDPADVQGMAMIALASIEAHHPGAFGERVVALLEKGLAHENALVRRAAFVAVHRLGRLPPSLLTGLLVGTRDPDPVTAQFAFGAIAGQEDVQMDEVLWHLVVHSLALAVASPSVNVRHGAASFIAKQDTRALPAGTTDRLAALKGDLAADICWSVRQALVQG